MDRETTQFFSAWDAGEADNEEIIGWVTEAMPEDLRAWLEAFARDDGLVSIDDWWFEAEAVMPFSTLLENMSLSIDDAPTTEVGELDLGAAIVVGNDAGGDQHLVAAWAPGDAHLTLLRAATSDWAEEGIEVLGPLLPALRHLAADQNPDEIDESIRELLLGASDGAAPARSPRLRIWSGPLPAHPWQKAQAHFGQPGRVLAVGPTAEQRYLVARRFAAGAPPTQASVVVIDRADAKMPIDWPENGDVYGMALVPHREVALVCTEVGGPIVALDLATGESESVVADATWSCGFLDDRHFAVLAGGEVQVLVYGESDVVARVSCAGVNIFVAHGCVFAKTRDFQQTSFQVWRWNEGALEDLGVLAVEGAKLFALHGASTVDGQRLVCGVDAKGVATWLQFDGVG